MTKLERAFIRLFSSQKHDPAFCHTLDDCTPPVFYTRATFLYDCPQCTEGSQLENYFWPLVRNCKKWVHELRNQRLTSGHLQQRDCEGAKTYLQVARSAYPESAHENR